MNQPDTVSVSCTLLKILSLQKFISTAEISCSIGDGVWILEVEVVEDGGGREWQREKNELGPLLGKVEIRWRRRGDVVVEGHVEWKRWDQRWLWEAREFRVVEVQLREARLGPSSRVNMCVSNISAWREVIPVGLISSIAGTATNLFVMYILCVYFSDGNTGQYRSLESLSLYLREVKHGLVLLFCVRDMVDFVIHVKRLCVNVIYRNSYVCITVKR